MKLIQKCGYIKAGGGGAYMKYIATREGVEIIQNDAPPTKKQQELVSDIWAVFGALYCTLLLVSIRKHIL